MISSIGSFYELMTLKLREIKGVMTDNLAPVPRERHVLNHPFTPTQKNSPNYSYCFKKKCSDVALTAPMKAIEQHTIFSRACLFFF